MLGFERDGACLVLSENGLLLLKALCFFCRRLPKSAVRVFSTQPTGDYEQPDLLEMMNPEGPTGGKYE